GETPKHGERSRQHADGFGQPRDRQSLEIADEARPRRRQPLATEAGHLRRRFAREQLRDQRAGVQITGRLAAREHDAHDALSYRRGCWNSIGSTAVLNVTAFSVRSRICRPSRITVALNGTSMPFTLR